MSLRIHQLSKSFGRQIALDDLTLTLDSGMVALLGANGSGKSTLLRMLATLTRPDSGHIDWNELDYARHSDTLRRDIGYLPQELELPDDMTPQHLLNYLAQMRLVRDMGQIDLLLAALKLADVAKRPLSKLSSGQIRLVGIAQSLLGTPHLLLLDEPFSGLSFEERKRVNQALESAPLERLTIFSTHIPAEAERLAQHILVLKNGRLLFQGTPDGLTATAQGCVYELHVAEADMSAYLQRYKVSRVNHQTDYVSLRVVSTIPPGQAARPAAPCLEDAYLLLTGEIPAPAESPKLGI